MLAQGVKKLLWKELTDMHAAIDSTLIGHTVIKFHNNYTDQQTATHRYRDYQYFSSTQSLVAIDCKKHCWKLHAY